MNQGHLGSGPGMIEELFAIPAAALDNVERRQHFFCRMLAIRMCEEKLLDLFGHGLVRGTVHTCIGQEACAVGVIGALDLQRDIVCSNHRGHGHYLAYCGDVTGLVAEIIGQSSGVCGGVGGSQHLHRENFYTNGILGGMPPVAVGMAAAEARFASGRIVCVFLGDGAMAEGSLYEAMNMASLWRLPILFAIEHNHYAQSTHWEFQHAGSLQRRPDAFGIPVLEVDGNDVEAVYATATECVEKLRSGQGPLALFLNTYRLGPHSKGDDLRDPEELAKRWGIEPLTRLRGTLDDDWCNAMNQQIAESLQAIIACLLPEGNHE